MIVWVLMALDSIAFITLTLAQFEIAYLTSVLFISGVYLIIKGLLFRDVMSMIDLVWGVYALLVGVFQFSSFLYFFILGWFLYKFLFTLAA